MVYCNSCLVKSFASTCLRHHGCQSGGRRILFRPSRSPAILRFTTTSWLLLLSNTTPLWQRTQLFHQVCTALYPYAMTSALLHSSPQHYYITLSLPDIIRTTLIYFLLLRDDFSGKEHFSTLLLITCYCYAADSASSWYSPSHQPHRLSYCFLSIEK